MKYVSRQARKKEFQKIFLSSIVRSDLTYDGQMGMISTLQPTISNVAAVIRVSARTKVIRFLTIFEPRSSSDRPSELGVLPSYIFYS